MNCIILCFNIKFEKAGKTKIILNEHHLHISYYYSIFFISHERNFLFPRCLDGMILKRYNHLFLFFCFMKISLSESFNDFFSLVFLSLEFETF